MDKIKKIIKYGLIMIIALFLLKQSYKGFELKEIWHGVKHSNLNWLLIAMLANIMSHVARAARWRLLMLPLDLNPTVLNTFISDLSGLFANLFLPRLGEIFRCTALKRIENIPVGPSLTTVVVERTMDVIVFIIITSLTFIILSQKMLIIFDMITIQNITPSKNTLIIFVGIIVMIIIISLIFKKYLKGFYRKGKEALKYFGLNLKYILKNKNKVMILFYTFFIWLFYFLSIYLVFFSIEATSNLKLDAGIIILIASSLGLAAPVQGGGAGAMHLLVVGALSIFHITKMDAILSATLIHGVQFITAILAGGLCMILSFIIKRNHH